MRKHRSLLVVVLLGALVAVSIGAAIAFWPQIIAFIVARIGTSVQAKRGQTPAVADSVWVGGRQAGGEIEAAPELHGVGAEDEDTTPGGAGARW